MTPIEQINDLKEEFLSSIESFFYENEDVFSIEFDSEENDLDIDPSSLTKEGVLTCVDEFGNDIDDKLSELSIEVVAYILTLIETEKYDVYERI